ncbi:MAG: hypothetical protein HQ592_16750 [Planctomycetes bacterium]|nr:hypothetical protein [Planctomycetota bacterium]
MMLHWDDPPLWRKQWLDRGGERFMSYERYARPRRAHKRRHGVLRPPPEFVRIREAICNQCEHVDAASPNGCGLAPHISKCFRRRATACCPADPPRWGPVA